MSKGQEYDIDFDHQFIETEKYDAKTTCKKFTGYSPGVAVIGDYIVGIENRNDNANVRAKWIRTSRTYILNIYTDNQAYARAFQPGFG